MPQAEKARPGSLAQIAEINPSKEEVVALRNGYEALLLKQGGETIIGPWLLGFKRFKMLSFSTEIEVEGKNIPFQVWRSKSKKPQNEGLYICIGMRTDAGENVNLVLEGNKAYYVYPGRSIIGQGFGPQESPTKKDLALHAEALEIATKQLAKKQKRNL